MDKKIDDNIMEGLQENDEYGVLVFGHDISKIPCFRNSFLTGIYGGVGCGVISFLTTSRPMQSTHFALGSFVLITLGYFMNCRYDHATKTFFSKQFENSFPEEIENMKKSGLEE